MMRRMGLGCPDSAEARSNIKGQLWREGLAALVQAFAEQTCGGAIPGYVAINLVKGLYQIGKAGQDGRELAQRRAFVTGFLTTLGHGMDLPRRTGAQAYQRALKDPTFRQNKTLAQQGGGGLHAQDTWSQQWKELAGHFVVGARCAREMLEAMPLVERHQLKALLVEQLQGKVAPWEDSFVGYLKGWLLPRIP